MNTDKPQGVPDQAFWSSSDSEWILADRNESGDYVGLVKYYRPDGTLCCATEFVDGTPHGKFERFHQNGETSREGAFVDGTLHGPNTYFRSTARTTETFPPGLGETVWRCEMDYEDGQIVDGRLFDRHGRRLMEDGCPFPETRPESVSAGAHFRKIANRQHRWVHGSVRDQGDGTSVRVGTWKYWTSDGVLVREENYHEGQLHGSVCVFDKSSGALLTHQRYDHGRQQFDRPASVLDSAEFDHEEQVWVLAPTDEQDNVHGERTVWQKDGHLRAREHYVHGEIHTTQEFLLDGSLAEESEFIDGGVPQRKWFRRSLAETADSFPNVLDDHPSAHEVEYLFDPHGMMTTYRILDDAGNELLSEDVYRNAGNDTEQRRFSSIKDASRAWIAEGHRYTSELNRWLRELYETGEPSAEEPDFGSDDLERAVIESVEELNRRGQGASARELFPLYHDGISKDFWQKYGLVIDRVLCANDTLYARIIPPSGDAYVMRMGDGRIEKMSPLLAFGSSHDKRFLAFAYEDRVEIVGDEATTTLAYPTRYDHQGADACCTEAMGSGSKMGICDVRVFPGGKEALLVTAEGIYLANGGGHQRLYPLDDSLDQYVESFSERTGGATTEYVFDLGVRFANADFSPRGDLITCGGMFRRGIMAGLAIFSRAPGGVCTLKSTSQADAFFPMQAIFHRERPAIAFGATLYASLGGQMTNTTFRLDLDALVDGDIDEFSGGVAQEPGVVRSIASFGEGFLLGFDNGYVRWMGVEQNLQLLGYVFVGGSIQHIDVCADQKSFVVASDAGLVSRLALTDEPSSNLIATMPVADTSRTAFFRTFLPLHW